MKKISLILLIALVVIIGCSKAEQMPEKKVPEVPVPAPAIVSNLSEVHNTSMNVTVTPALAAVIAGCTHNSNCTAGEYCINASCQAMASFYATTDCPTKCNLKEVEMSTSDGETYTVPRGQGSYTAGGAVQWKILSPPSYCQGSEVLVPISVLRQNYQHVSSDDVILLKAGETSKNIEYPLIKNFKFTLMVKKVTESCG